jgi:CIC family chloride channel protein
VFSPSLFIGATLGATIVSALLLFFPHSHLSVVEFAVVGMGALVGGATGGAMTAIVMIFEMTRDYNVIVPLVLTVALAVGIRRTLIADNIYTIKLRNRGRAIPTIRHTNMYLVQQVRDLMSRDFIVLPAETRVADMLERLGGDKSRHVIVSDGTRIAGFVRLGAGYRPDRYSGETLRDVLEDNFVIAPESSILNAIITRMNRRRRTLAIVVNRPAGVPRPQDVVGVIDSPEIADAVIANHYA